MNQQRGKRTAAASPRGDDRDRLAANAPASRSRSWNRWLRTAALDCAGAPPGLGDGGVPGGTRLLRGQRPVGRPEPQRVGQRLAARPGLIAGIDVKELQVLKHETADRRGARGERAL